MRKLFDKSEVIFAVVLIVIYVVGSMIMAQVSEIFGTEFLAESVFNAALTVLLLIFITRNRLMPYLGLCRPEVPAAKMLFYIPLILTASVGVITGFAPQYPGAVMVTHTVCMIFTGFLEEIIFRGFLFRGMAKSNMKSAVIVSALTFGIGHIVNLLNGYEIFESLVQIIYAICVGFLLVFILIRTGSIIACIVFHMLNNVLAGFGSAVMLVGLAGSEQAGQMLNVGIRIAVAAGYLLYVLKCTPKTSRL